jgi:hypothetical protein
MLDPFYLGENFFALVRSLYFLGDADSMRQCLFSMCKVSLRESWRYHEAVVWRLVQFMRFICDIEGSSPVIVTLQDFTERWNHDNECSKYPLASISTVLETANKSWPRGGWRSGEGEA